MFTSCASAARWVSEVRDSVQDKWPYLSLLPEQRSGQPSRAVGGVNTVVPLVVRVPKYSEGPDGNPEVALGYDVSGVTSILVNPSNNRKDRCISAAPIEKLGSASPAIEKPSSRFAFRQRPKGPTQNPS